MGLTIALNRGRILDESLPLLEAAGIRPVEDISASRKLVFETERGDHKLVIMRGSDVPTYVAHGVADVGITGKDTLLEYRGGTGFYERLDLGIGRCRIMLAAPSGATLNQNPLRVATKFVRTAENHYASIGRHVSIIALSGAVELAPLMDLADCIVDIVDTGNTLKANGLEPIETIADISARLIVNHAAMKTRFEEVQSLIEQLREELGAGDAA